MANALFALIPEARLRGVMGALHRFSDLPLRLLDAEGNILCALGELAGCCALLQRELNTWQECNALHAKAGARARELGRRGRRVGKQRLALFRVQVSTMPLPEPYLHLSMYTALHWISSVLFPFMQGSVALYA